MHLGWRRLIQGQLFERTVVPKKTNSTSSVTGFVPHPPKKKRKGSSSASSKRRYSKESLKVGDAGEKAVLKSEKDKLRKADLDDLVEQVDSGTPTNSRCVMVVIDLCCHIRGWRRTWNKNIILL